MPGCRPCRSPMLGSCPAHANHPAHATYSAHAPHSAHATHLTAAAGPHATAHHHAVQAAHAAPMSAATAWRACMGHQQLLVGPCGLPCGRHAPMQLEGLSAGMATAATAGRESCECMGCWSRPMSRPSATAAGRGIVRLRAAGPTSHVPVAGSLSLSQLLGYRRMEGPVQTKPWRSCQKPARGDRKNTMTVLYSMPITLALMYPALLGGHAIHCHAGVMP